MADQTDPLDQADQTIHLDRPADEVFGPLADLGRSLERDHDFDQVERVGDPPSAAGVPAVGTRFVATNRVDGRPEVLEIELVEVQPPRRLVLQATSRGAVFRETLQLADSDGGEGCTVTVTTAYEPVPEGTDVPEATDDDPETGGPPPPQSADRPAFARIGVVAARNVLRDDPDPR